MVTADDLEQVALAGIDAMESEFGGHGWRLIAGVPSALDMVMYIDPVTHKTRRLTDDEKAYIRMRAAE